MPTIHYTGFAPEVEAQVRGVLGPLYHLLPSWLEGLTVSYRSRRADLEDPDPDTCTLALCIPKKQYRSAKVEVLPAFLGLGLGEQEQTAIHEFLHIPLLRYQQMMEDLIRDLSEDTAERRAILRVIYDERESVTDDIAFGVHRALEAARATTGRGSGDGGRVPDGGTRPYDYLPQGIFVDSPG